jgi:formylglycine-generating enzyme required for sulfatase activity
MSIFAKMKRRGRRLIDGGICVALGVGLATVARAESRYVVSDGREVAPLELFQECAQCPEMIVMPMGSFMMGARPEDSRNPFDYYRPDGKIGRRAPGELNIIPSEHPRHRVEIDIPYAMGRNEVTHEEWMACVEAGGCSHVPEHRVPTLSGDIELGPRHPVVNVSYRDAQEYVGWLNGVVGAEVYRLPTEAEWEYAARAGTETRFAQGDDLTPDQANFSRVGTERLRGHEMPELVNRRMPVTVDELDAANGWGLRHMSGNVDEQTRSCWTERHLGLPTSSAYLALSNEGGSCKRVGKGGSFAGAMDFARPAAHGRAPETYRRYGSGFRVVRQL